MRSRDLIDGFDYNEHMQRQMFCFGSSDDTDSGADSESTYSGGLNFDEEFSGDYGPSTSGPSVGGGSDGGSSYSDLGMSPGRSQAQFGTPEFAGMTETQAYNTLGTSGGSEQAQQVQADIVSQLTRAGNQGANQLTSVPYVNAQIQNLANQQLEQRMQQAKAGYGLPGFLGAGLGMLGQFNLRNIAGGIGSGGRAFFGPQGQIQGVFTEGPFGGEVYTGNAVEGYPETGYVSDNGGDGSTQTVKPVNPVTGQCDAGYIFDEDLQACRLDTRGGAGAPGGVGSVVPPTPGGYARMGLLDVAPTGLPQFQQQYGAGFGTPQDFAAANLNFRRQGATYPEYFQRPPQLSGYTLLS